MGLILTSLSIILLSIASIRNSYKMDLTAVKVKELESDVTDLRCRVVQLENDVKKQRTSNLKGLRLY